MNHYLIRREILSKSLGDKAIAIIPTAVELTRNADNTYLFRADSYFYYLTGFGEPNAYLLVDGTGKSTLFCQPKDELREIWDGVRLGPQAATAALGVSAAYSIDELDARLPEMLKGFDTVWYPFGIHAGLESRVHVWINALHAQARSGCCWPTEVKDLATVLGEMRLVKDAHEIDILRQAGKISAKAHVRTMQTCARMIRGGQAVYEYTLDAELLHEFRLQGSEYPAYPSIVAGGANACILHYRADKAQIHSGDLVLIDAGCELNCYASDITRTFPANGKFTRPQRLLYDLVLASQEAALKKIKPGTKYHEPHDAVVRVLSEGMLEFGLLDKKEYGTVDDVIEKKAYTQFFMHGTGHWMGLDVHDCGDYKERDVVSDQRNRLLVPGMVLTVEPGIYVRPVPGVPEEFHHIGIRIEDDAIVTHASYELTTRDVPVKANEIEAMMQG